MAAPQIGNIVAGRDFPAKNWALDKDSDPLQYFVKVAFDVLVFQKEGIGAIAGSHADKLRDQDPK